jgi:prepilin-type N-terminal cleavage/methylation domain-containing protein
MGRARVQSCRNHESGFTLVEIMVAITILLIGVLGVVTMVSAANRSSSTTTGRQNATNLMRRVIETGRAVPYRSLTSTGLVATLQGQSPDLADSTPSDPAWTVQRAGFTYTLTARVCLLDDAADGYGVHDASDPGWCADSSQTGTADDQSHDYKRLNVTATWTVKGQTKTMTEAGLVPSTGQGDLPSTTSVTTSTPSITSGNSVAFDVTAINAPTSLLWLVDGQTLGSCPPATSTCSGSGASWAFTWGLGTPVLDTNASSPNNGKCIAGPYTYDGTHRVSARAYNSSGLTGEAAVAQVSINRCPPLAPSNFNATGRNGDVGPIDIEWTNNLEDDVIGYRVFRGTTVGTSNQVCPPNPSDPPIKDKKACIDPSPVAYSNSTPMYYTIAAYDRSPAGAERAGAVSYLDVNSGNHPPKSPINFASTRNPDGSVTLTWALPNGNFDPDAGDTIASFRVYRRAGTVAGSPTYADRYDYDAIDAYCTGVTSGSTCQSTDTAASGTHTYTITSVDQHLRESSFTANEVR